MVFKALSEAVKHWIFAIQEFSKLAYRALVNLFSGRHYWRDTLDQMDSIGVGSITIVCLTGLFTGMVLTVQSSATLDAFGARPYVGRMVSLSMIRELGPVLTALMVSGRVGSGMAAELGSMVVTQQIDALRSLGTDPIRKLVVPRMIAGVVMVPTLTVLSNAVGMVGGYLVATLTLRLATSLYWHSALDAIRLQDLFMGLAKPFVFGYIIATVGCYQGLTTTGGTRGVGESTTQSVVVASVLILATDYFLNLLILKFVYP
ncbi:MAG TPA: ABC transporter permease [Vicinamibacteria bacterium]|nr:ABC transporter permease [Vicinamibacteria bacterium]